MDIREGYSGRTVCIFFLGMLMWFVRENFGCGIFSSWVILKQRWGGYINFALYSPAV
jgi:hypothetical protein